MSKLDYTFSDDYMVLRPDRAGALDLLHLLFSSHVWKNRAVDCFTGTQIRDVGRRWALFVSLLLQTLLLRIKKPLEMLGMAIEFVVNFVLIILHGNVEFPDEESARYRSINNLISRRIEFEGRIGPSSSRGYHEELSAVAARLAYENESFIREIVTHHWQMDFLGFYNCWNEFRNCYSAQAFAFSDKPVDAELVVVVFRGTKLFDAEQWCSDIDVSWYEIPRLGKVRAAFINALGLHKNIGWPKRIEQRKKAKPLAYYSIRDAVKNFLHTNKKARLVVTGHGSGGALAVLFLTILAYHKETSLLSRFDGVYTFVQPCVGDGMLRSFVEEHLDRPRRRFFWTMQREGAEPFDHLALSPFLGRFKNLKVLLKMDKNIAHFSLWIMMQAFAISTCMFVASFVVACGGFLRYKKF